MQELERLIIEMKDRRFHYYIQSDAISKEISYVFDVFISSLDKILDKHRNFQQEQSKARITNAII